MPRVFRPGSWGSKSTETVPPPSSTSEESEYPGQSEAPQDEVQLRVVQDREEFALASLRQGLDTCTRWHGNHCNPVDEANLHGRPRWLIDVRKGCIKKASPSDRYVTLSYVWGQDLPTKQSAASTSQGLDDLPPLGNPVKRISYQTLTSNLNQLQQDDSLLAGSFAAQIPQTIKDVMRLVTELDDTYLWVDRLCIVQDDQEEKHQQIEVMAAIYSNAHLTVVAAQGCDVNSGLYGQTVRKSPRIPNSTYSRFDRDEERRNVFDNHYRAMGLSVWSTRGWTLQELLFSRRSIFFFEDSVTWECHCDVWGKSYPPDGRGNRHYLRQTNFDDWTPPTTCALCDERFQKQETGFQYLSWPDLEEYARIVCDYNRRQLTYTSDIYAAFQGVTSTLSRTFEDGFLHGLPEMFIDVALLWQPHEPLVRRDPRGETLATPSWSWTGWQGSLDLKSWASGYVYVETFNRKSRRLASWRRTSLRTESLVKWYVRDGDGSSRELKNSAQKFSSVNRDALPPGWYLTNEKIFWDQSPGTFLRHESDRITNFSYPIPICSPEHEPEIKSSGQLLCSRTRRAWFHIGRSFHPSTHSCRAVCLLDDKGSWAGVLRLNEPRSTTPIISAGVVESSNTPQSMTVSTAASTSIDIASRCELVMLSTGRAYSRAYERDILEEWELAERPNSELFYEFYNVLWIEWQGEIAYRRALGRVLKEAWDVQATEWIDLVLG